MRAPVQSKKYYERVEELKQAGHRQADAIRQVAEEMGVEPAAVRQGIYSYRRKHVVESDQTFDSYMTGIASMLEKARRALDQEVERTRIELEKAQLAHAEAVRQRDERLPALEQQLSALR